MRRRGVRQIVAVAVAALALGAQACREETPAPRDAGPGIRTYPPPAGSSPERAVRDYVGALNHRDGRRFCGLVAPYISGRFELAGRDPEGAFRGRSSCPDLVSRFIGYIEDCCPPEFLRASISGLRVGPERHGLVPVRLRLTVTQEDTGTHRRQTVPLGDTVWLGRFNGGWQVAKLSAVARAASLQDGHADENVLAPPDVAAETRRFARERAQYEQGLDARKRSFGSGGELADCSGGLVVEDASDDLVDYRSPAPKTPRPPARQLDLQSLTVRSRTGEVCLDYRTATAIKGPAEFVFNLRDSAAGGRFIQTFYIELRRDGSTRVTSGEDDDRHPIPVPARVGHRGTRLTVVLTRASFAAGRPSPHSTGRPPLVRFAFMAGVSGEVGNRVLHDDLGPSGPSLSFGYPGGNACPADPAC